MEFLLQLFAGLVGSPAEEEVVPQKNDREKGMNLGTEMRKAEEEVSEEPVLFELMQFH